MTVAVLVEGQTDKLIVRTLIDKIWESGVARRAVTFRVDHRSNLFNADRVGRVVRYDLIGQHPDLEIVIVCLDMECEDPEELGKNVQACELRLNQLALAVRVKYHLVRYAIESWLIADEGACGLAFPRAQVASLPVELLNECDPKTALTQHLRRYGIHYRPTIDGPRVAKNIELERATRRSPNLEVFLGEISRQHSRAS